MALLSGSGSGGGSTARLLTVPALLLLLSSAALLVFLLLPAISPSTSTGAHLCACTDPVTTHTTTSVTTSTTTASPAPVATSPDDVAWLKAQLASNSLALLASTDAWHRLRKGINPRTRDQQLFDINRYTPFSPNQLPKPRHFDFDASPLLLSNIRSTMLSC
jgi:hypothetical protein